MSDNHGKEEIECEHDWVYADVVLMSNPPQYPRICRKCGKKGILMGQTYYASDYNRLVEEFEKKNK